MKQTKWLSELAVCPNIPDVNLLGVGYHFKYVYRV